MCCEAPLRLCVQDTPMRPKCTRRPIWDKSIAVVVTALTCEDFNTFAKLDKISPF